MENGDLMVHLQVLSNNLSHCGTFSTPHFHPSWVQIFASGSCFQIPLACIPPLMQEIASHSKFQKTLFFYFNPHNVLLMKSLRTFKAFEPRITAGRRENVTHFLCQHRQNATLQGGLRMKIRK